jgi:aminoglycoside phosphotransferase (APT) family kinase protein
MAREYRVLAALQGTGIPVPQVIALCEDESVIGARFYVMEWIDGHVVRDALPVDFPNTAETRRAMSSALIETLLQLHAIEPDAIGLSDFGHPDGFLARQVRRWWQQWEASKTRELPSIEALRRRLDETVPAPSAAGIVHGDYRLDNVMYAHADPSRIVAVIDWEMCTIGDPLCDVGLLCVYWADDESEAAARTLHGRAITVEDGFYKRADLLRDYAAGTKRDLTSLDWYIALGAYKLAIIAEGITARFLMGMTVGEGFETMGEMVPAIVDGGLEALGRLRPTEGG